MESATYVCIEGMEGEKNQCVSIVCGGGGRDEANLHALESLGRF